VIANREQLTFGTLAALTFNSADSGLHRFLQLEIPDSLSFPLAFTLAMIPFTFATIPKADAAK